MTWRSNRERELDEMVELYAKDELAQIAEDQEFFATHWYDHDAEVYRHNSYDKFDPLCNPDLR